MPSQSILSTQASQQLQPLSDHSISSSSFAGNESNNDDDAINSTQARQEAEQEPQPEQDQDSVMDNDIDAEVDK